MTTRFCILCNIYIYKIIYICIGYYICDIVEYGHEAKPSILGIEIVFLAAPRDYHGGDCCARQFFFFFEYIKIHTAPGRKSFLLRSRRTARSLWGQVTHAQSQRWKTSTALRRQLRSPNSPCMP